VPRASTTSDAFNAVAEPRRRRILDVLAGVALAHFRLGFDFAGGLFLAFALA